MDSQSKDFKFFLDNHKDLYDKYPNKVLVIKEEEVLFAEDTFENALETAISQGLIPGTFIIQECTEGEESYTQSFSSRVVFA